jgi:hypothetical protein
LLDADCRNVTSIEMHAKAHRKDQGLLYKENIKFGIPWIACIRAMY